ncbi:hypothetical protein CBOM_04680 [Ceraceosorus bombacis]|uniref:Uncharacterized protein n=2 Tax=Ceraceosorus TaxID=401624 RepID=A0A0P1BN22_9BASI|nr:hypothetical protein IE81DRAFT_175255 [Ceraceosorus guamensis]PWN41392.1 hypothetical protein IE81DRAFT_175255 [Ceraceosorus guamensis]CEH18267.1 hypothetical protein CBOM_04680 [Ceraceosorus bombacis]
MPPVKLTPNQQRIRVMVVSFPFLVATSWVLFKRLYLGEEQRKLPRDGRDGHLIDFSTSALKPGEDGKRKSA